MRRRALFYAQVVRSWDLRVVQVPEAEGVHAIVPDGLDPADVARQAIAVVLELEVDQIEVIVESGPSGVPRRLAQASPSDR